MKVSSVVVGVLVFVVLGGIGAGLAINKVLQIEAAAGGPRRAPPPTTIEAAEVRRVEWQPTADLVGTVFSLRSVRMSNEVAGRVREVHFDSGSIIEPGNLILVLDDAADQADLAAAQAAVRVAEANVLAMATQVELADTEYRQVQAAAMASAVTDVELARKRSEYERAKAEHGKALAEVDQATARIQQVQARLDKLRLKAPFRARAGIRTVHEGQFLPEGTVVATLEEVADRIYLDFAIPQEYLSRVRVGTAVEASSPLLGNGPVRIEVVAIDAIVSNETRNVRIRSIVDNSADRLRPGMSVPIRVPSDEPRPFVVVPATAVRRSPYGDHVFALVEAESGDGLVARQRFVKIGPSVQDDVIVEEGLEPGERVATVGSFKLHDGSAVLLAPSPTATGQPTESAAAAERR